MNREDRGCLWLALGIAGGTALAAVGLLVIAFLTLAPVRQAPTPSPFPPPLLAETAAPTALATGTPTPLPPTFTPPATTIPAATPLPTGISGDEPRGPIVFACFIDGFDDICSVNADGSDLRRLTAVAATDFYPEWGPLGRLITFSSRRNGAFQIFLMMADGREVRQLSPGSGSLFAPDISPDGKRLVFTNAGDRWQNLWIMNVDGSGARPLTSGPYNDVDPVWSPDGTQIAFASDRGARPAHWIMDADGSNMRMLSDEVSEHGGRSDWSPDGRWLAFYAGPRDDRDIYLVATDGSGETRRLTDGGRNLAPSFSPDGNWLAFTSYRDGDDAEIFIMRADGSDVRQVTFNEHADWQPRWAPVP